MAAPTAPPGVTPWPTGALVQNGSWLAAIGSQYPNFPTIMQRWASLNASQKATVNTSLVKWKDTASSLIQTILQIQVNKITGQPENATLIAQLSQLTQSAAAAWKDAGLEGIPGTFRPLV